MKRKTLILTAAAAAIALGAAAFVPAYAHGPGFGVIIDEKRLEKFTLLQETVT